MQNLSYPDECEVKTCEVEEEGIWLEALSTLDIQNLGPKLRL